MKAPQVWLTLTIQLQPIEIERAKRAHNKIG